MKPSFPQSVLMALAIRTAMAIAAAAVLAGIPAGCASASSEITPAESAAAEKSVSFTGQSSKRSTLEITIGSPSYPAVGDESEAK